MTKIKTRSFAVIHFSIAFTVTYTLTGDACLGGLIAIIEPGVNSIAYFFHEKAWGKKNRESKTEKLVCV